MPTRLIVASSNPVKIQAAVDGFRVLFPDDDVTAQGVNVPSGVSDQPMGDEEETLRGALNRAHNARIAQADGDYWVGIEGGCADAVGGLWAFAWVVVLGRDRTGRARTGAFQLPEAVAELVRQGLELGDADDRVFGRSNSKQANGAIGLLTNDAIDRAGLLFARYGDGTDTIQESALAVPSRITKYNRP